MKQLCLIILFSLIINISAFSQDMVKNDINRYDIKVKAIEEHLEIETLIEFKQPVNNPELFLCKNFRAVEVANIKVTDENNEKIDYTFQENILKINIYQEKKSKVNISYELHPIKSFMDNYSAMAFESSSFGYHINAAITRTDYWFPRLMDNKRLPSFNLSVDVPREMEVMASGRLYYIGEYTGRKIYKWKNYDEMSDRSLYFFARKCKKVVKTYPDGFKLYLYVPEDSIEKNIDYVSDVIYKSYKFFEEKFGSTGLKEYKAMAEPFGYSGLYNSMTLGDEYFTKKIENNDVFFPTRNIVHEVSHTWWGNIVSPSPHDDYWLYEGFAKFSEIIALKTVFDKDIEIESFQRLKLIYMTYYGYDYPIQSAGDIENRDLQVAVAYFKGGLFLKNLELIMGKDDFYNGMKEYVREFRGKVPSSKDFEDVMVKNSKVPFLKDFLNYYIQEKGLGEYYVSKVGETKEGMFYINRFRIDNMGNKDIYTIAEMRTSLKNYRQKLYISKGGNLFLDVKDTKSLDCNAIYMDGDNICFVTETGVRGPGGYVYITPDREVKFAGLIENGALYKSGIRDTHVLYEINSKICPGIMNLAELNRLLVRPLNSEVKLRIKFSEDNKREFIIQYR